MGFCTGETSTGDIPAEYSVLFSALCTLWFSLVVHNWNFQLSLWNLVRFFVRFSLSIIIIAYSTENIGKYWKIKSIRLLFLSNVANSNECKAILIIVYAGRTEQYYEFFAIK